MKKTDIENRLIEIAKQNPTGDYYVGDVGMDVRSLLRDMMGGRYPSDLLDAKPYVRGPRPDPNKDPIGAMMWDDSLKVEEMMIAKMSEPKSPWMDLANLGKLPQNMGATVSRLVHDKKA